MISIETALKLAEFIGFIQGVATGFLVTQLITATILLKRERKVDSVTTSR